MQRHRSGVKAGTRLHAKLGEDGVIRQRERRRIDRAIEKEEETVGAIDLENVVMREKLARLAVVRDPQLGRPSIPQAFLEARAVDDVRE